MNFKYRPDIDGLRAIAVLSVVFYHYGIGGLQGGFVGVDVFFVISGYLITGIIHSEMQRGEFTLARFYERRARRIFPALFAMLLATMAVGLWLLLPSDLANLGRSSVGTILFVSNVLYMRRSGYFDSSSDFNPLLHTWSLGVEEQFYLGLPLLMLLVGRFWARGLAKILALSALASFVACVLVQPIVAKAVFFLSPFRAWELLLGSLLGIGAIPQIRSSLARDGIAVLALIALLCSLALMREGIDFPGWKAAIPVVATALLLHVGASDGSRVNVALSWKPLVFIGLISYSLYLWHWPLLVLVKYRNGMEPLSLVTAAVLFATALLLALASYYAVERPFRKTRAGGGGNLSQKQVFAASGIAAVALLATGFAFVRGGGFPARVPVAVAALDHARSPDIPFKPCDGVLPGRGAHCRIGVQEKTGRPVALIWGDSHALAWAPGMDGMLKAKQWTGLLAVNSECAPLLGLHNPKDPDCRRYNDQIVEWVKQAKPDRIYMIAAWYGWSNAKGGYDLVDIASGERGNERIFGPAFNRTIERVLPWVRDIVVIGPTPGAADALPYKLAMSNWGHGYVPDEVSVQEYRAQARSFWSSIRTSSPQVRLINPEGWFCHDAGCRYVDSGKLLYRDGHHLNVAGAIFAAGHLAAMDGLPSGSAAVAAH